MNQDLDNIEEVDGELQDEWLSENLKYIQVDPSKDFTKKVVEQFENKPNLLSDSPLFWILVIVPAIVLVWLIFYSINSLSQSYHFNVNIPEVSNIISFYQLSKYALMVMIGGLFFIGLDYFLNKHLSHKKSFFSFMFV